HNSLKGKNRLVYNICQHYVDNFIGHEKNLVENGDELIILDLEQEIKLPIALPPIDIEVNIKGTIDRIDSLNGMLRIMDYKTGTARGLTKAEPSDCFENRSWSKELQLRIYAWLYSKKHGRVDFGAWI